MLKHDTVIPGLEVPNLDCLSPEDLDDACDAFLALHRMATMVALARRYRLAGAIVKAKEYEAEVDRMYAALPQSMRY